MLVDDVLQHVHARTGTRSRKKRRERSGHRSPRSPKGATEGSGGKEGGELGPRPTRSPGQRDPGRQTATTVIARRAKQAAAKVIKKGAGAKGATEGRAPAPWAGGTPAARPIPPPADTRTDPRTPRRGAYPDRREGGGIVPRRGIKRISRGRAP